MMACFFINKDDKYIDKVQLKGETGVK